uniref:Uncharacterized protein n=1 Tax=Plectus sambesii TaxID=2011161 RepID=A0A914UYY7_9BILA
MPAILSDLGLCSTDCGRLGLYFAITWVGLFIGNLFFMSTMMVVLRCVYDDQKAMALSVASCITNILGFIPAPILFGWLIDSACVTWHSRCTEDRGNCVIYDNNTFRFNFHIGNAGFQALAVIAAILCYVISRSRKLPEEEYADQSSVDHSIT